MRKGKRNSASVAILVLFILTLSVGVFAASRYIGKAEARAIALTDAGLTEDDVTFIRAKLDRDDGRAVYDVEFYTADTEYDYEIDAVTGEIREFDREVENFRVPRDRDRPRVTAAPAPTTPEFIGEEAAKAIAFELAGVEEADVTRLRIELDRDDGRYEYEIEFRQGRMEYEFTIDATDGTVYEQDAEYDD